MKDIRETAYNTAMTEENSQCRFKVGDKVLSSHNGEVVLQTVPHINWDKAFGGWLLFCHLIGGHEQNYILESEQDQWEAHEDGLWSWWERKGE